MKSLTQDKGGQGSAMAIVIAAIMAIIGGTIYSTILSEQQYSTGLAAGIVGYNLASNALWLLVPTVLIGVVLIGGVLLFARGR